VLPVMSKFAEFAAVIVSAPSDVILFASIVKAANAEFAPPLKSVIAIMVPIDNVRKDACNFETLREMLFCIRFVKLATPTVKT